MTKRPQDPPSYFLAISILQPNFIGCAHSDDRGNITLCGSTSFMFDRIGMIDYQFRLWDFLDQWHEDRLDMLYIATDGLNSDLKMKAQRALISSWWRTRQRRLIPEHHSVFEEVVDHNEVVRSFFGVEGTKSWNYGDLIYYINDLTIKHLPQPATCPEEALAIATIFHAWEKRPALRKKFIPALSNIQGFGKLIKEARVHQQTRQSALAKRLNISVNDIWDIEYNGLIPDDETIGKLGKELSLDSQTLLTQARKERDNG